MVRLRVSCGRPSGPLPGGGEGAEALRQAQVLAVVDRDLDERRPVVLERAHQGGVEVGGRRRPEGGQPERLGVRDEVRVRELDPERAPELGALLPVDQPVAVVAPDDDRDVRADPAGRLELLASSQEPTIARGATTRRSDGTIFAAMSGFRIPIAAKPLEMITVFGS